MSWWFAWLMALQTARSRCLRVTSGVETQEGTATAGSSVLDQWSGTAREHQDHLRQLPAQMSTAGILFAETENCEYVQFLDVYFMFFLLLSENKKIQIPSSTTIKWIIYTFIWAGDGSAVSSSGTSRLVQCGPRLGAPENQGHLRGGWEYQCHRVWEGFQIPRADGQ